MENVIIADEKYSKYWIWALLVGITTSLSLYIISINVGSVLANNYLQLGAFVTFTITIFAVIKLWEGKKSIRLTVDDDQLMVDIFKGNDTLQRDTFNLHRVSDVYLVPAQYSIPFLNIYITRSNAATFQLAVEGQDHPVYLFQFSGQVISVSNKAAQRLSAFFEGKKIPVIDSK